MRLTNALLRFMKRPPKGNVKTGYVLISYIILFQLIIILNQPIAQLGQLLILIILSQSYYSLIDLKNTIL